MPLRALSLRLTLIGPPADAHWAVQLGRAELLPPTSVTKDRVNFEVPLEVAYAADGTPRLRGPAVQGPSGGRFLYVNSGSRAGVIGSVWDRRAKVPLEGILLRDLVATSSSEALTLYAEIAGTAKDGGPACASVKLLRGSWSTDKPPR